MYTHGRKLRGNENKLRTISLETSSGKVDQILRNETNSEYGKHQFCLPGIRCVNLDVILPTDVILAP